MAELVLSAVDIPVCQTCCAELTALAARASRLVMTVAFHLLQPVTNLCSRHACTLHMSANVVWKLDLGTHRCNGHVYLLRRLR